MSIIERQDWARLWCKLTNNQRLLLINETVPRELQVRQSHNIVAIRALTRKGLIQDGYAWSLTFEARELTAWAVEQGYARYSDGTWLFSEPEYGFNRVDRNRLEALVAIGYHGAEIARRLKVSREAVSKAAKRYGLTLPHKPKKTPAAKTPRPPRIKRTKTIMLRLTEEELAAIKNAAVEAQLSVSAHLRKAGAP